MRNSSMSLQFSSFPAQLASFQPPSAVSNNTSSESLSSTFSRDPATGSFSGGSSRRNSANAAMSSFVNGFYNKAGSSGGSNNNVGVSNNGNTGTANVVSILQFPRRVHQILDLAENEGKEHIISWVGNGRAFRVHDQERFGSVIMPRFFKQTSFRSFERQLLQWGFKIITNGPNAGSYFHPKFIRGQPQLCQFMVREKLQGDASSNAPSSSAVSSFLASQKQSAFDGRFGMPNQDTPKNPSLADSNASNLFSIMQQRLIQEKLLQSQDQQQQQQQFQQHQLQGMLPNPVSNHASFNDGINSQQQQQFNFQQQQQQQQDMLSSLFNNNNNNNSNNMNMSNKNNFSTVDHGASGMNFMNQVPKRHPGTNTFNQVPSPDLMTMTNVPVSFSNHSNPIPRTQSLPFPWKLHDMLTEVSQQGQHDIVSWNESGTSFKIHNPKKFERSIMLQYFRQTKYKSFQRQLNLWGFERVSKGSEKGSYRSPHFLRADKSQCRNMTHTSIKGTSLRSPVSTAATASKDEDYIYSSPKEFIDAIEDEELRQDVQTLHDMIRRVAPGLPVPDKINKNLLEYGKYSHHYKTGKVGEWCKVGISYGKQITLHCSGLVNNKYVIGHFADHFPRAKAGITSLRFSRLSDLNMRSLESLIHATAGAELSTDATMKEANEKVDATFCV